ncbi:uncharacterized protein ARB_00455 [Trichophyton benhamiae CBS 112371]|uniref:Uncharacterized protein n=1 Tax=Arthroderma benhamiae (strain ATCC MYA-4681 / CBS 112371) TaxID=663331 RepID=D4AW90_ARTBC|nr:uncharacterized protein ARB_00455 [Trichophyton benhamiae CBS 112371]EFE32630.1 hypothetical protein ARB_00455 [Trichophyton benhamiae CBS 112371]
MDMSMDDEFLSQEQRDQLFRGIFPADYSGEVISIKTSRAEYSRLFEAFEKSTNKFVFLFLLSLCADAYGEIYRRSQSAVLKFDKTFHTTSIQLRQVSIHECVISNVSAQLRNLMPLRPKRFSFMKNTEIDDDLPDPDLQMVWRSNMGVIPVLAMEVGFSQPSLDLEMTIRKLLQKASVKVGILVDIKESPSYKNPLRNEQNIEICKAAMQASTDKPELLIEQYCAGRELFSPVVLYGIQWVGELTAAVQVFGKDSVTGEVVARTPRVPAKGIKQSGAPIYEAYPSLNTKFSDCVDSDDEAYNVDLALTWDDVRDDLDIAKRMLARKRCSAAVSQLKKEGKI